MFEGVDVGEKSVPCLHVGCFSSSVHESHCPDVLVAVVTHHCRTTYLSALLQVEPKGDFGSVERWLLNARNRTFITVAEEWSLISGITEEVAFEHYFSTLHFIHLAQDGFCLLNAGYLPLEKFVSCLHMEHGMYFSHFTSREVGQFNTNPDVFYVF